MATEVSKAVLDDITIPALGINIDKLELVIVLPDQIKISVISNNTFFLFQLL